MSETRIVVPMEPPSVNGYVRHARGRHFKTKAAEAWEWAMAVYARNTASIEGDVEVEYIVYRGKGSKGDVDNYAKVILDGLKNVGVLKTDDAVTDLIGRKRRDRDNPRTEIIVRSAA